MDIADGAQFVFEAYGWNDIPTDCEFVLDYEDEEEEVGGGKRKKK